MTNDRFDDLDLREEPASTTLRAQGPGWSFQTLGCNKTANCTNGCCPPSWDACA
ncbi:MAG: hypothetical protein JO225_09730 [Candidatus Eremiobacteraeota bacterium]|nr:hypothetical protein [Candidatus Eremiobacteraeota bacterium]